MHCLGQIANPFWRLRGAIKFAVVVNAGNMRFTQDLTFCTFDLRLHRFVSCLALFVTRLPIFVCKRQPIEEAWLNI